MSRNRFVWLLLLLCSFSALADGAIRRAVRPVKNKYRVRVVETLTPDQVRSLAAGLAMQHRGALGHVFENVVPGFVVSLPEEAAAKLSEHPLVESVEEASEMTLSQVVQQPAPWHLDRIDQRTLPLNGSYKTYCLSSTVHAYVVDSGIRASHNEFMTNGVSRVIAGKNFATDGFPDTSATNPCPGATYFVESTPCTKGAPHDKDCLNGGHGTAVASILAGKTYGASKHVKLISARIRGCRTGFDSPEAEAALIWIYNDHATRLKSNGSPYPAVVNMSFEMPVTAGSPPTALEIAATKLVNERGIVVVAAAGNGDVPVTQVSPARLSRALGGRVITVGGSTNTDRRWRCNILNDWEKDVCLTLPAASNHGSLDIFAPSQNVPSAGIKGPDAANNCCIDSNTAERPRARSGTSFSAPIVAGIAAIHLTNFPTLTPDQVWDLIRTQASGNSGGSTAPAVMPVTADGPNSGDLNGSPNRLLYRQGQTNCTIGFN